MYTPRHFLQPGREAQLEFMRSNSFAVLVTADDAGRPHATHVPVTLEEHPDGVSLLFHLARANPQAQQLDGREALCIFSGPHAYISPGLYEQPLSVPTWNYIAVHAYGTVQMLHSPAETLAVLEHLILQTEPAYLAQWAQLPDSYRAGMLKGLIAFRLTVREIQGKEKLSQNRSPAERGRIIGALAASPDSAAQAVAQRMREREQEGR